MHMPTPTSLAFSVPRSAGPLPLHHATAGGFDPVQIAWIDPARPDDLDPAGDDPLAPLGQDAAVERGLHLRPWSPDDLGAYRALLDDARVWAHLPEPYPDPLDEGAAAALIALSSRLGTQIVRAAVCDGQPVGQVRLDLSAGPGTAELSYWLGAPFWGQGFGTALIAAAVTRAFGRRPDLLRLTAKVHPGNPASARALARAGFVPCAAPGAGFGGWNWFHLRRQAHRG